MSESNTGEIDFYNYETRHKILIIRLFYTDFPIEILDALKMFVRPSERKTTNIFFYKTTYLTFKRGKSV